MVELSQIEAKSILTKASGFLEGFNWSLNPYRGCSFSCCYCYARKHLYNAELEAQWGSWLGVKANAPALLKTAVERGKVRDSAIYMSSVTDPYVPIERRFEITRQCLAILLDAQPHRLVVQTRGPLVERDIDLLKGFGERAIVSFFIPTDSDEVRKTLEPMCASIERRLRTIRLLSEVGIRAFATLAPTLPCDPKRYAALVDGIVEGVIVSGLRDDGADGRNTPGDALELIRQNGWEFCLDGNYPELVARQIKQHSSISILEGRKGFLKLARI